MHSGKLFRFGLLFIACDVSMAGDILPNAIKPTEGDAAARIQLLIVIGTPSFEMYRTRLETVWNSHVRENLWRSWCELQVFYCFYLS
jgi:hypothetical protein